MNHYKIIQCVLKLKGCDKSQIGSTISLANTFQEQKFHQFLAYTYLDNANKVKYGTLLTGLHTQTSLKND
jgi:hypothetical protein